MKKTIKLIDLDCANFMAQKMTLEAPDDKFSQVLDEAKAIIHKLEPDITIK